MISAAEGDVWQNYETQQEEKREDEAASEKADLI